MSRDTDRDRRKITINTHHYDKLSDAYLANIQSVLRRFKSEKTMSLEELDGFLTALQCFSKVVPITLHLSEIWGGEEMSDEDAFETEEQAEYFFKTIATHWNNIQDRLSEDDIFLPITGELDSIRGHHWATGFLRGAKFSKADWLSFLRNEKLYMHAVAIIILAKINDPENEFHDTSPETHEKLLISISAGISVIYDFFAEKRKRHERMLREKNIIRRESPKIGRNSPCSCGSGKKYKSCCATTKTPLHEHS
jgi:uncharacterized protein